MKVVIIIQARMGSTRLPGKVLMAAAGRPMLSHQIERLNLVRRAHAIVVATTHDAKDDRIVEFCKQNHLAFYRGDEHDVLSRFAGAARQYQADVVVRLTADCPLIDPSVVDQVIARFLENPGPRVYVSNTLERSFPRGMDAEAFSAAMLFEAEANARLPQDREHVTPYLIRNDRGDIEQRNVHHPRNWSAYRFTLDYPKDFDQISSLLALQLPDFSLRTLMQAAAALGLDAHDNSEADSVPIARAPSDSKESKVPLSRFGLGTAQFGMHYGRFNRDGVPSRETASAVLQSAASLGLSCIDTAHLYGEAESVLGHCHDTLKPFSVITKTPRFADDRIHAPHAQRLREAFIGSLQLMHQSSIEGLLIHHAPNLLAPGGQWLYEEMCALKHEGLVRKIGVSAYTGEVAEAILQKFPLDLVQLPVNLLDNRLIRSGALKRISSAGVEIHARSAFLQGLLLADPDTLSQHFDPAKAVLKAFHTAARHAQVSPAHAALHYLIGIKEIDKIIVGVESLGQFQSIFADFPERADLPFENFSIDRGDILNPVLWVN